MVKVLLFATLTVPVQANPLGIVKLIEGVVVASPTNILDPVPDTAHAAAIVGVVLLIISYVMPAVVKLVGDVPVPSKLTPQLLNKSKVPLDLEKYVLTVPVKLISSMA